MSSISGISEKPPSSSNTWRRTKRAWSPVAMPVMRDRRFIKKLMTRPQTEGLSNRTLKRPPTAAGCLLKANSMIGPACAGNCVSACRKSKISPWLAFAPSFIWRARPRDDVMMRALSVRAQNSSARLTVLSVLPPSTMMISLRAAVDRHARVRGRFFSSFKVGMTTVIAIRDHVVGFLGSTNMKYITMMMVTQKRTCLCQNRTSPY